MHGPCGKRFARNSHAGFGKPFYEPNMLSSMVFGRKVLTKSGVAISRKSCFPHGAWSHPMAMWETTFPRNTHAGITVVEYLNCMHAIMHAMCKHAIVASKKVALSRLGRKVV